MMCSLHQDRPHIDAQAVHDINGAVLSTFRQPLQDRQRMQSRLLLLERLHFLYDFPDP